MSEAVLDWDRFKFTYDRISLKLYACEHHLKNLKYIESKYGSLDSTQAQNSAEIEIDAFHNQMIGTVDSLLFKINDKFRLNISVDELEMDKVQSTLLSETKRIGLLVDLDNASQYGNWYWMIELRNYSLHGCLITDQVLELAPNFKAHIKIIPFFEQSLNYLRINRKY
jgi:hypothetical protein